MVAMVAQQQPVCPYLPPELWQRILFQHTDPNQLWTVGRQVCSTWRSEIPKLFAKKYLEDPAMVQIHFDLGRVGCDGRISNMVVDMVFDRYEGDDTKAHCVFAENPLTTGAIIRYLSGAGQRAYERKKNARLRKKMATYLGSSSANGDPAAAATAAKKSARGRARFDLPPYQVRIKSKANDTTLPNLKLNLQNPRTEVSFEWHGMFAAFFSEATLQSKKEREIIAQLAQSLNPKAEKGKEKGEDHRSLANIITLVHRHTKARHASKKAIRRGRIKKLFSENHAFEFPDKLYKASFAEHDALRAIASFERHTRFDCCAEDAEERRKAKSYDNFRRRFDIGCDVVGLIRERRGGIIRGDEVDDASLRALFNEMEKVQAEARARAEAAGSDYCEDSEEDSDEERLRSRVMGFMPSSVYDDSTEGEDGGSGIEEDLLREEYREEYGGEDSEEAE
jgi:hypothetical protein